MQTGQFLLVTDTQKQVRRKVLKKSSRPREGGGEQRKYLSIRQAKQLERLKSQCFPTTPISPF